MRKIIIKLHFYLLLIYLLTLTACEKMIAIDPPLNETSTESVYSSDRLAANALSGIYGTLSQSTTQSLNLTLYSSLQADDLLYLYTTPSLVEMNSNSYSILSTTTSSIFSEWYSVIYRANAMIEGLKKYNGTSDSVKIQYTAQAKFIRAYCYFNLVNTFGDIPLVLTTDVTLSAFQPRNATSEVYKQIITDLTDAKADLMSNYSATNGSRVGVNKYTATALLARVYLFTLDFENAEKNASEVIESGLYSLISKDKLTTDVFQTTSIESIWLLSPYLGSTNRYTAEGSAFNPFAISLTYLNYQLRTSFLQSFNSGDSRKNAWTKELVINGNTYTIPYKYKYRDNTIATAAGGTEYCVLMRLSEQYLIRAESRIRIGSNVSGALSDLNIVHTRAGLSSIAASSNESILSAIDNEYRWEFFCEQGFRWFNLKRRGQADLVLSSLKPTYRTEAQLLPIPQTAIDANPNLTQNLGY